MDQIKIAWHGIHTGEEPPLAPAGGVFFSGCNLRCIFCQNYQISQQKIGKFYSSADLAGIMIGLQNEGAKNIDLVTPTIWYKQIKTTIIMAKENGLKIPIVWNSNGYEETKIIQAMDGLIDVYLPDFKYSDDNIAFKYSGIKNYFETASQAIAEMFKQVGQLQIEGNIAKRGLIVRHLVLPNNLANSFGVLKKLAALDQNIHISLMNQYFPLHQAKKFPELCRTTSKEEFNRVYNYLLNLDFKNGWVQGEKSQNNLIPDFSKTKPF